MLPALRASVKRSSMRSCRHYSDDIPVPAIQSLSLSCKASQQGSREGTLEEFLERVRESKSCTLENLLRREQQDFRWLGNPRSSVTDDQYTLRTPYIAIDCEMISTSLNANAAARVAVVNEYGMVLLDTYIRPAGQVKSYRTRWSGISKRVLAQAEKDGNLVPISSAVDTVCNIAAGRIIVGHAVANDMQSLGIMKKFQTVDTQKLRRFKNMTGLRRLMCHYFDIAIQSSSEGHDPVEDARASMLLFRTFRHEFDQEACGDVHESPQRPPKSDR